MMIPLWIHYSINMIEENRNSIIIRNVDFESNEYKRFEKAFSLYNNVTHKFDYSIYTIVGNDIHIPETVTPSLVQTYFVKDLIVQNYAGTPAADSITFKMLHTPRTDIQREALAFLLTIKNDKHECHRMLNLATGSGKTYMAVFDVMQFKPKHMLFIVHRDNILHKACESFKEILMEDDSNFGFFNP